MRDKQVLFRRIMMILSCMVLLLPLAKLLLILFNIPVESSLHNGFNEVRDYVNFRLARVIYEGKNPYSLDILGTTNAPLMFFYPALYPLMVAGLCRLTGLSIVAGYYAVNIQLVALTAICVWVMVKGEFKDYKAVTLLCVVINAATFFSVFGLPVFNFHTDTVGIVMTVVMFLIVYKKKEWTWLLALLSVLLIFTKQILLIMVVPIFIYLLIRKPKLALLYFIECIVMGAVTLAVIQFLFPLYWTETIYAQFCVNGDAGSLNSATWNIFHFYRRYIAYLLAVVIGGIVLTVRRIVKRGSSGKFTEREWFMVYLALNVFLGTASLLYIARGDADGSKYCQDILAPSLFMLTVFIAGSITSFFGTKRKAAGVIVLFVLCLMTTFTYEHFQTKYYSKEAVANMTALDSIIAEHEGEKIYLSMMANAYSLNRNIWEDDSIWTNDGQIEYFYLGEYSDNETLNSLFYGDIIEKAADDYVAEVNEMIGNREFGLVTTCCERVADMDLLAQNYYVYDHYLILTDTNDFVEVYVWLPRS